MIFFTVLIIQNLELENIKKSIDRKPGNGMLEKAIKKWNIDRSKSFMIGDQKTDMFSAKSLKLNFFIKKNKFFLKFSQLV